MRPSFSIPGLPRAIWLCLLAMAVWPAAAHAEQRVRVGTYQNAPKIDHPPGGRPSGIFIDVIESIARSEGWSIEYVPGTFSQGLARLQAGEIDLMPDVARNAERERLFAFPREPVLSGWNQVYARRGSNIRSLLDLSGKRVAVLEGSVQQSLFVQMAAGFGVQALLIPWPDYASAFEAVARGRADAVVSNHFYGGLHAREAGLEDTAIIFSPSALFFAGNRAGSPELLAAIDRNLQALKKDPSSAYYLSMRRWAAGEPAPMVPAWMRWAVLAMAFVVLVGTAWILMLRRAAEKLRSSVARQRELAAKLGRIFEYSLDTICVLDARMRFLRVSHACAQLWGLRPEELVGQPFLDRIAPEDRDFFRDTLEQVRQGRPVPAVESLSLRKDGTPAHIVCSAVWSDAEEELYCIARDDTERRDLLARVRARTAELQSANDELQMFSSSVSHDLRAPLSTIAGFTGKLLHDHAGQLGGPAPGYLQRVLAAAQRMALLIDDLLTLSRISQHEVHRAPCAISDFAAAALETLREAEPGRRVRVSVQDAMQADADPGLVRILLENLLGNAWKFTAQAMPDAAIAIGSEFDGRETVYFVRDNGAGFDMAHAAKLFKPFERLHHPKEFAGTGIGLSIVHRIVAKHGGRVWAESGPGQGAVFRFTLAPPPKGSGD